MAQTWLTSDTHFYHDNIIKYCNRPFKDSGHMNEVLISNWNKNIRPEDTVIHLGDFAMGFRGLGYEYADVRNLKDRLNGKIILIKGNHDRKELLKVLGFEAVLERKVMEFGGVTYYLSHHPFPPNLSGEYLQYFGAEYQLCGHVHEKWKQSHRSYNIGVDVNDFSPVAVETLSGLVCAHASGTCIIQ